MTPTPPAAASSFSLEAPIYCPACGYDLRGLTGTLCPECGSAFDPAEICGSRIPWLQRQARGRLGCFWKTVWHVLVRRRAFHAELHHPVSLETARAFRRLALWHLLGPLALLALIGLFVHWFEQPFSTTPGQVLFDTVVTLVLLGAGLLFLLAATATPGLVLVRQSLTVQQRNSVLALSYYTCGPLALIGPVGGLCVVLGLVGDQAITSTLGTAAMASAFLLPLVIPLGWLFAIVRLAREGLGDSEGRVLRLGLNLFAWWSVEALALLAALPAAALYILLAVATMMQV